MGAFLIFYGLTIVSSIINDFRYKKERLKDVGNYGYKLNMDRLEDYFLELPDVFAFQLLIPIYNMYKTRSNYREYHYNKEEYLDILYNKKIINRMNDTEYTEYRENKSLSKLLDISDRNEKDNRLLKDISDYLFDVASNNTDYSKKKVIDFSLDDDSHFACYYDNKIEDFVTIESDGIFDDLEYSVRNYFLLNITKLFGDIYGDYGSYKDKLDDITDKDNTIKLNVEGNECSIKIKNLYEYVPDEIFESTKESKYSKLLKK